jgi:putative sigma-54 modulation protein
MNIKIHAVNFNISQHLTDFVNEKVSKLDHYYDAIVSSEIYLKLENTSDVENKISEVKVLIPGSEIFVKKKAKSFEEATDLALEAAKKQISKHKEKVKGM